MTTRISKAANGAFASIAVLATAALLPSLNKSMWRDEGASLYSAHLSWTGLWQQSRVVDRVLLFYYSLLHVWLHVFHGIEGARSLSLVAFALTVYVVARLGYRLGGSWCGVAAGVLTAINPLMIRAALEARPYALATLTATLSVAALFRWVRGGERRWMWVFCCAYITTLLLQMFMVLAPISVIAVIFILNPQVLRLRWRGVIAPIGLAIVATFSFLFLVVSQRSQIAWIPPIGAKQLIKDLVGPASGIGSVGGQYTYVVVIVVLVLATTIWCVRGWRRGSFRPDRRRVDSFIVCLAWAVLPTLALIIISSVKPIYVDRYVTASVPGMALSIGMLIVGAKGDTDVHPTSRTRSRPRTVVCVSAVGIAVCTLIFNSIILSRTTTENIEGVTHYVALRAGSDSEVALPDHSLTTGVNYYLQSFHVSVSEWPQLLKQPFVEGFDLSVNRRTISTAPRNVWLVDDGSVLGTNRFVATLGRDGYVQRKVEFFSGVIPIRVVHFVRTGAES